MEFGIPSNQMSATLPNEHHGEPLPDYTKTWGPNLYRPPMLPDHHDTRIDSAHIFVFTVHPITGIERDFYVTPKPCDYCTKVRQICSRTRPQCHRCSVHPEKSRDCVVEEGWVRLPGPKCQKPNRKRTGNEDAEVSVAKKSKSTSAATAKRKVVNDQDLTKPLASRPASRAGRRKALPKPRSQAGDNVLVDEQPPHDTDNVVTDGMAPIDPQLAAGGTPSPARSNIQYGLRPRIKRTVKSH